MIKDYKILFSCNEIFARRLNADNLDSIQKLLNDCNDFSILVTGESTLPNAAKDLLMECPPGIELENKYVIGLIDRKGVLIGLLDAVNGYPKPGIWFIGLLLFSPDHRQKGLGKKTLEEFEKWILSQGATEVRLGVVEANKAAIRFWKKMEFHLLEKRPPAKFGLKEQKVLVFQRILI